MESIGPRARRHHQRRFGCRWLDLDYTPAENETLFKNDVLTQGPMLGFGFRL